LSSLGTAQNRGKKPKSKGFGGKARGAKIGEGKGPFHGKGIVRDSVNVHLVRKEGRKFPRQKGCLYLLRRRSRAWRIFSYTRRSKGGDHLPRSNLETRGKPGEIREASQLSNFVSVSLPSTQVSNYKGTKGKGGTAATKNG